MIFKTMLGFKLDESYVFESGSEGDRNLIKITLPSSALLLDLEKRKLDFCKKRVSLGASFLDVGG